MGIYETARSLAHEALEDKQRQGRFRVKGKELLEWIQENRPEEADAVSAAWQTYLTRMVSDPDSRVVREPGKYGFMLSPESQPPAEAPDGSPAASAEEPAARLRTGRERRLYHLLTEWLQAKGYRASDTSQSKAGGPWGNPDVVGVRLFEGFGATVHIDLVSIEAKLTERDWKKWIFESVSHKRFADRAYFAFGVGSEDVIVSSLPDFQKMREYGEKFGVGVLAVFIEPTAYESLISGVEPNLPELSLEDVRVEEVWPATFDPVPAATRETFIKEVLGLTSICGLATYGT